MNNVRKCAIAGVAALAAGAGAYLTMPAGRALSEREKRETWGNQWGATCHVCTPEENGLNCNSGNYVKAGDTCAPDPWIIDISPFYTEEYACNPNNMKGSGIKQDQTHDVKNVHYKPCLRVYYVCSREWETVDTLGIPLPIPQPKWTWVLNTYKPPVNTELCGRYSFCESKTTNSTCPPPEENE